MRRRRVQLAVIVAVMGLLGVTAAAVAGGGGRDVREHLTGYQETPQTLSTSGVGVRGRRHREQRHEREHSEEKPAIHAGEGEARRPSATGARAG